LTNCGGVTGWLTAAADAPGVGVEFDWSALSPFAGYAFLLSVFGFPFQTFNKGFVRTRR